MAYKVQKTLVVHDRIYGDLVIEQPVIAELIQSQPMQRLKRISQDGAPHFIQPVRDVTRFEHSIGAWYLSHRYNRPIEEQIATLLHDVPHTAFSHVIDVVMDDERHEYHDRFTKDVILASDIPPILAKHGVDIDKVLNKEMYHLLENDLPDISVDRWDYFMRDGYMFGLIPEQTISLFLASVKEKNETFYFDDLRIASLFAMLYLTCDRLIWLDPTSHGSFYLLATLLKYALREGIVREQDFSKTDKEVWDILIAAHNPAVDELLGRLRPGSEFVYTDEETAEFYGRNKPRFVDPLVAHRGQLRRVSELVPGVQYYFEEFKHRYQWIGVRQLDAKKLASVQ